METKAAAPMHAVHTARNRAYSFAPIAGSTMRPAVNDVGFR